MKTTKDNYSIIFEKLEEVQEKKEYIEKEQFKIIREINDEIALMKEYYTNVDMQDQISFTRT